MIKKIFSNTKTGHGAYVVVEYIPSGNLSIRTGWLDPINLDSDFGWHVVLTPAKALELAKALADFANGTGVASKEQVYEL